MAYATFSDVSVRYRPITTMIGTGPYDVTSEEVTSVYIAQSEAYIDAFLARRYQTPLTISSPLITQIASDLAIFHMIAEKLPSVPEFMDKRKERCDKILEMLANGDMQIGSASLVTSAGDSYAWSSNMGHTPVFSPVLGDLYQRADPDRVRADKDARDIEAEDCG
jgi:phage gp36-like protein